jgi:hypothetical protein
MKTLSATMIRSIFLALMLVAPALLQAQSFSWKAPESVQPGKAYTVSVSCLEYATVVLMKNGVIVAVGSSTASVSTSDNTVQTVTYTAHAYGGNPNGGSAGSSQTVEIVVDPQPRSMAVLNSGGVPAAAAAPEATSHAN